MALDELMEMLVRGFAEEAAELCRSATGCLLELEGGGLDPERVRITYERLARNLHTLKGTAGTLGLDRVSELAHAMEDLVLPLQEVGAELPPGLADGLLSGLDLLLRQVRAQAAGERVADGPLLDEMARLRAGAPSMVARAPLPSTPAREASPGWGPASLEDGEPLGSWRVDAARVMALMRDLERLRETRLRLEERGRELQQGIAQLGEAARARLGPLAAGLVLDGGEVADVLESLDEAVKAICTVPVGSVIEPLHRAVRDLCRSSGKKAKLSVVGAELSLDRRLVEALAGPLVHLVRNAVDHGIELPAKRQERGKHEEGALVIRIEQHGNTVFLEAFDDGGGMDLDRIRQVAQERGLASPEALAGMSPEALRQFIFTPGFSTQGTVTESSGRGVGLDVVRTQIRALHGEVEVQSTVGQGTRFVIRLPAELGSSPQLLVRCEEHVFGLPLFSVEAVFPARRARMKVAQEVVQVEHGARVLSVQDLGAVLRLRPAQLPSEGAPLLLITIPGERRAVALHVDEVLADRDLVIRPLPPQVRDSPAFLGASTLARGEPILVLRPDWLVSMARVSPGTLQSAASRRALVIDDSLAARALHRAILETGGYNVHTVGGAEEALRLLERGTYEVVICDVAMKGLSGLDFLVRARARPQSQATPVVLVSALASPDERARGLSLGADGYLSKDESVAERLLGEVASAVARRRS